MGTFWCIHLKQVVKKKNQRLDCTLASRGEYFRWNNFWDVLPHPLGLGSLFTSEWNIYAQNGDSNNNLFGTLNGVGTSILTFLVGFYLQAQSLWLTHMIHHHLAIAFIFLIANHFFKANFEIKCNDPGKKEKKIYIYIYIY